MRAEYSEDSVEITKYLITLRRLSRLITKKFRKFKDYVLKFVVRDKNLFRRASKNISLRRVINSTENRTSILYALYKNYSYREKKDTYRRVTNRY